MHYVSHILDLVGHTPLVRLGPSAAGLDATILVKVEYLNPGGSIKDRVAAAMIDRAEKSGELRPGGTIVEPTSGNTGVGLAMEAQRRGYRAVFVVPDKVSDEKVNVLRALGARVEVAPTAVEPSDPRSYYSVSDRLLREIPGAWKPNQYANPANPASHYASTGPEIWRDTDGAVTHLVAGIGTGGTITGTGRYLKDASDGSVQVVGADPAGSVYSGDTPRPYLVEGVGEDFFPPAYDPRVVDRVLRVSDAVAFDTARLLARREALFLGGSSGLAVAAALRLARELQRDDPAAAARAVIVVIAPDGGRGYLSKIYDDAWMRRMGFLLGSPSDEDEGTVEQILAAKDPGSRPALVALTPADTLSGAIGLMRRWGISQLPVAARREGPMVGEILGAVTDRALARVAADDSTPVGELVGPALPEIGAGESAAAARTRLLESDALLVVDRGRARGILTREDVLGWSLDRAHGAGSAQSSRVRTPLL